MFRAQILRRGFSLWTRTPKSQIVNSAIRDGHETIHIQRVRINKPFFNRSRVAGAAVVTTGTYGLLRWLDAGIEDEEEDEDEELHPFQTVGPGADNDQEDDLEDEEDDEALLFFPTGLSRPKPRTFYRGSDPEWQEFVRLAQDKERSARIRREFVDKSREAAAAHPLIRRQVGKITPGGGNAWVEIIFPSGPPIEYERSGYDLTESLTLRPSTRPVETAHHQKLVSALYPVGVANAVWIDCKQRALKSWRHLKSYVGLEEKRPQIPMVQDMLSALSRPPLPPNTNMAQPGTPPAPSPNGSQTSAAARASTSTPATPPSSTQDANSKFGDLPFVRYLPQLSSSDMVLNLTGFRMNHFKKHRLVPMEPPRGTLVLTGLVEIHGDRARMTLDAKGFYDPKTGQFLKMQLTVKTVRPYKQYPRS